MARENRGLVAIVVILVIALIVVFYFWQREEESEELEFEVGQVGDAGVATLVGSGAPLKDPGVPVRFAPAS